MIKLINIFCVFLLLSGCKSNHDVSVEWENKTKIPQPQNVLHITDSTGKTYEIALNEDVSQETYLLLRQLIDNDFLKEGKLLQQKTEFVRLASEYKHHKANLTVFYATLFVVILLTGMICLTWILVTVLNRRRDLS